MKLPNLSSIPKPVIAFVFAVAIGFVVGFLTRGFTGPSLSQVLSGSQVAEFPDGTSLWFYQPRPAHAAISSKDRGMFGVKADVSTRDANIQVLWRSRRLPPQPIYFPRDSR